jgi:hypothetical protein
MSFLSAIPIIGQLFDSIGNAIDKNVTTDHERLQVKAELTGLIVPFLTVMVEAQKAFAEMQTRIAEIEAQSEHWIVYSRRPIIAYVSITNFIVNAFTQHMPQADALNFAMLINGLDTGTRGVEKMIDKFKAKEQI